MERLRLLLMTEVILIFVVYGLFLFDQGPVLKGVAAFLLFSIALISTLYTFHLKKRGKDGWDYFLVATLWEFCSGIISLILLLLICLSAWYGLNKLFGPHPLLLILNLAIYVIPPLVWVYIDPSNRIKTDARRSGLYLLLLFALLYVNKYELTRLLTDIVHPAELNLKLKVVNILLAFIAASDRFWKNLANSYVNWREMQQKFQKRED